jgi:hypothetical protein
VTHSVTTTQTAKAVHSCLSCYRTIDPGEKYYKTVTFDGTALTYKQCVHCDVLAARWHLYRWSNWEGCGREDFQEYGRDAARDTISDARLYVQWTRGWRRRDGGLYPVPRTEVAA